MAQPKKKTTPAKTVKSTKVAAPKKTEKPATRPKKTKNTDYKTLRLNKSDRPFLSTNPTSQTMYWLIISAIVLVFGGWIVSLQVKINGIYDSIDANQQYYNQMQDLELRIQENKKNIEVNKQKIDTTKQ